MAWQNGKFIPEEAIGQQYKFADDLSNQKWAPTWAGVLAGGLAGIGSGIHRNSAQNALQGNQSLMAQTLKGLGDAKTLEEAQGTLLSSEVPSLQKSGADSRLKSLSDDPNKEYRVRAAQWKQMGYTPETAGYKDWVLTGKLPDTNGGMSAYGMTGQTFQAPDGRFFTVQFGRDGSRRILPVEVPGSEAAPTEGAVPLAPSRGVVEVDTGTGTRIISKATGEDVREIDKDLRGAEAEKVRGKTQAEGEAALPKARSALKDYELKSKYVGQDIDRALAQASPWTTGFVGNLSSWISGSPAHDLSKTLTGIQANLGFESLQTMRDNSPTGGALGSVTERELELLQSTWGSLMQSQSEEQLRHYLNRLKEIKAEYAVLKREAYERDVARFGAANVPKPEDASGGDDGWTDVGGVRIREKK
jgi:hypothetical protein